MPPTILTPLYQFCNKHVHDTNKHVHNTNKHEHDTTYLFSLKHTHIDECSEYFHDPGASDTIVRCLDSSIVQHYLASYSIQQYFKEKRNQICIFSIINTLFTFKFKYASDITM